MEQDFFSVETAAALSEGQLLKALSVGAGTDSAQFTGGRAMVPEDIEGTMVNAMRERREDCKLMSTIKKQPVFSTVHEIVRRKGVGLHEFLAVPEGGGSDTSDQDIERKIFEVKFLQDRRSVTDQMAAVRGIEDAFESEKLAGTLNVLKAAEHLCFHGDSLVVPEQFDGVIPQIKRSSNPNVIDIRGQTIATVGERIITDAVHGVFAAGGDGNKLFFPPVFAQDIQDLVKDRLRFGTSGSGSMALVVDQYPTPFGSTVHFGQTEGADRFYKVKGPVEAIGSPKSRPKAPSNVATAQSADGKSKFATADAGNYKYTVHSINRYGISEGKDVTGTVAVTAGNKVTITITESTDKTETGYIICRSKKDGNKVMEMTRIGKAGATTTFDDFNIELPGTGSMLLITDNSLIPNVEFLQLLPLRYRPLYESNTAEKPFFIQLFGSVGVKVPEYCAVIDNIAYKGGLY